MRQLKQRPESVEARLRETNEKLDKVLAALSATQESGRMRHRAGQRIQ